MKLQKVFFVFLALITAGLCPAVFSQVLKNEYCPVMKGTHTKEQFFVDYAGDRIYLCCRSCVRAFEKNPGKYIRNLNNQLQKGGK